MTKEQQKHVDKYGRENFRKAMAAASISVRSDQRLTGADKIRKEVAEQAALEATGFPRKPLILSKLCGEPNRAAEIIAQEAFVKAFAAASKAVAP